MFEPLPFPITLQGTRFGRPLLFVREVDSTNRLLRELAAEGATEGTVVLTDFQQAGKGRKGRSWTTPPGSSLLLSLLLRPAVWEERQSLLPLVVVIAVARTLEKDCQLQPEIKWPNDILLDGRKCCGILVESEFRLSGEAIVVVGIGLNVNQSADDFEGLPTATSLRVATGQPVDRALLLSRLLAELERAYTDFEAGWEVHAAWRKRAPMLGRIVRVFQPGVDPWEGPALDLAPDGGLLVEHPSGKIEHLHAADVSVRSHL